MPKLDLERVIALENRQSFKKNVIITDESSSASQSMEPGSFQNETLIKQTVTYHSGSELKDDLD